MSSRELDRAARQWADSTTARIADVPASRELIATVATVGASVTVTWRGVSLLAAAVCASYTPAPGDRVLCVVVDDQLIVRDQLV